jgi:hypothetical protein
MMRPVLYIPKFYIEGVDTGLGNSVPAALVVFRRRQLIRRTY